MKKVFLLLSLISISFYTWSDDRPKSLAGFDPATDIISEKYEAGPYLIYDCASKHWTCVSEDNFKECKNKRRQEKESESVYYSCSAIGALPTKKSCFQRQLYLVTHAHGQRFCVKDNWKEKAVY